MVCRRGVWSCNPRGHRTRDRVRPNASDCLLAVCRDNPRHLRDPDDDFAVGATFFDVGQGFFGRFEGEDAVDDGAQGPGIDERGDLAQLVPACFHEEK